MSAIGYGVLSGALQGLSLRSESAWALAWIALVPLLWVAGGTSRRATLLATIAYAVTLAQIGVTGWLARAAARYAELDPTSTLLEIAGLVLLVSALHGLVLAGFLVLRRARGPLGVVWCAAAWVAWEGLRVVAPPYFPVCSIVTSQVALPSLLQLASLVGAPGIAALVVATNAAVAQLWLRELTLRRRLLSLAAVASTLALVVLWGRARVDMGSGAAAPGPVVLAVDGAAREISESSLERYVEVTSAALHAGTEPRPHLILWPESALSVDLERDGAAWRRLRNFVDDAGVPLATGGAGSILADDGSIVRFNSVHFVRPRHGMRSYHKRLLVPLAEAWPDWAGVPPPALDPVSAGRDVVVFEGAGLLFGPIICSEIADPATAPEVARRGARFIASVNNDVWFLDEPEAPHLVWARIRAVETGLPIVRAANAGTTALIDPFGRMATSSRSTNGPTAIALTVPAPMGSLYVKTGDVLLPVAGVVVVVGLVPRRRGPLLTGRRRSPANRS